MDSRRSGVRPAAGGPEFNIDEELERFVSQIEENTYTILSIKQKFNVMRSNSSAFESGAQARLTSFETRIDELEKAVSDVLAGFHSRLDRIDVLAFRPDLFHPAKVVTMPDSHQITAAFYAAGLVFLGTDASSVHVYNANTLKFVMEIGPIDGNPVIQIGNAGHGEGVILAVRTCRSEMHLFDVQNPSWRRLISATLHVTWPSDLVSPFRLATVEDGKLCMYDDHMSISHMLDLCPMNMYPAQNRLLILNEARKLRVLEFVDGDVKIVCDFRFEFPVRMVAASTDHFVVSGDSTSIAVCQYGGDMYFVKVEGPSLFLFAWGQYYFRVGENTLIEARDFGGRKDMIKIGNEAWWPHESQKKLSACGIYESRLLTCMDMTCAIWT